MNDDRHAEDKSGVRERHLHKTPSPKNRRGTVFANEVNGFEKSCRGSEQIQKIHNRKIAPPFAGRDRKISQREFEICQHFFLNSAAGHEKKLGVCIQREQRLSDSQYWRCCSSCTPAC